METNDEVDVSKLKKLIPLKTIDTREVLSLNYSIKQADFLQINQSLIFSFKISALKFFPDREKIITLSFFLTV